MKRKWDSYYRSICVHLLLLCTRALSTNNAAYAIFTLFVLILWFRFLHCHSVNIFLFEKQVRQVETYDVLCTWLECWMMDNSNNIAFTIALFFRHRDSLYNWLHCSSTPQLHTFIHSEGRWSVLTKDTTTVCMVGAATHRRIKVTCVRLWWWRYKESPFIYPTIYAHTKYTFCLDNGCVCMACVHGLVF